MSGPTMNAAQRCALERLADLIDQQKLDIYPTLNDEDSYVRVNGELVFTGRLTDSNELRAAIARAEQEPTA